MLKSEALYIIAAELLAAAVIAASEGVVTNYFEKRLDAVVVVSAFLLTLPTLGLLITWTRRRTGDSAQSPHSREFAPFISTSAQTRRLLYTVREFNHFSHNGECHLTVDNGQLQIVNARRWYMRDKSQADGLVVYRVDTTWRSEWCQVCDDGFLRFLYNINLAETVRGICEVRPSPARPIQEMSGSYQRLYPAESSLSPKMGTITFEVFDGAADVPPPPSAACSASHRGS